MKRWMIIVLWFSLQFLWNFLTKTIFWSDHLFIEKLIEKLLVSIVVSVEYMFAPIQIIALTLPSECVSHMRWG